MWLKPGMRVELPSSRGRSITMIGAVSTERGFFHAHTFAESNNTDTFIEFLIKLREKCEGRNCIVVMDNLSVHKTAQVKRIFTDTFRQMFLPVHSCELNPIEKVWNVIKNQWRRNSYHVLKDFTKPDEIMRAALVMIQGLADNADQEMMKRVAKSNYRSMALTLNGFMV